MGSLGVIKPDMRIERQDTLSPFGLLTQLFTEELLRRNTQVMGNYRPMQLAYLEEGEQEAEAAPPEIHFDLDMDLIVNRLLKQERDKKKETGEKKTPAERILERVILREKEIRTAYPETRRIVVESGGKRISGSLPLRQVAQANAPGQGKERVWEISRTERQAGERRSTQQTQVLRPSAALAPFAPTVPAAKREPAPAPHARTLTLASQAMSVPAAGGWTPQQREVHPGYPSKPAETGAPGLSAGSILLPDVMRRRREAALERRETAGLSGEGPETLEALENALTWATEGTDETPETERVRREVRRAVLETIRRNTNKDAISGEAATAERSPEKEQPVSAAVRAVESGQKKRETSRPAEQEETAHGGAAVPRSEASLTVRQPGQAAALAGTAVPQDRSPAETKLTTVPTLETETAARTPLIYREEEEQPPRQTPSPVDAGRQPSQNGGEKSTAVSAGIGAEHPAAEVPYVAAAPIEGRTARSAEPAAPDVPVSQKADEAKPLIPAAVPTGAAAPTEEPADLVYREGSEGSALPRQIGDARPAPPAASAVERRQQPEPRTAAPEAKQAELPSGRTGTVLPAEAAPAVQARREESTEPAQPSAPRQSAEEPIPQRVSTIITDPGSEQPRGAAFPVIFGREDTRAEAAVPEAIPAEATAPTGEPAALVYREGSEDRAMPPVPRQSTEEQGTERTASAVVENRDAEPPFGAVSPVRQQPVQQSQMAETALQAAVPEAIPAEPIAQTGKPAALVYREGSEDRAMPPVPRQSTEEQGTERTASAVIENRDAEPPFGAVSPVKQQPVQQSQMAETALQAAVPEAIPAEPIAQTGRPAVLVYREESEAPVTPLLPRQSGEEQGTDKAAATFVKNEDAEQPVGTVSQAKQPPAVRTHMPEDNMQTAVPEAIPTKPAVPTGEPAAMIYRENKEEPALSPAPQQGGEALGAFRAARVAEDRKAELSRGTVTPEAEQPGQRPVDPEMPEHTAEIPAAIPAGPAAPTNEPAALVYREEANLPAVSPVPRQRAEEQSSPEAETFTESRAPGLFPDEAFPAGEQHPQTLPSPEMRIPGAETPPAEIPAAVPAESEAPSNEAAALVYREEESALPPAPQQRADEQRRPETEAVTENRRPELFPNQVSPADEEHSQTPLSPETLLRGEETPSAETKAAIPAESAAPGIGPAVLVYREGSQGPESPSAPQQSTEKQKAPAAAAITENQRVAQYVRTTVSPESGQAARTPEARQSRDQETESPAAALPAGRTATAGENPPLVYREGAENQAYPAAEAGEDARPAADQARSVSQKNSEERRLPGNTDHAAEGEAVKRSRGMLSPEKDYGEQRTPESVIPTAIPQRPDAAKGTPAELVYRQEAVGEAPQTPETGMHPRQPEESAGELPLSRSMTEKRPTGAFETVLESRRDDQPQGTVPFEGELAAARETLSPKAVLREPEIPAAEIPAAIPAEPTEAVNGPAALVYREETTEQSRRTSEAGEQTRQPEGRDGQPPQRLQKDDRQPQRSAEAVVEDQPRSSVSPKGEQRTGQMPVRAGTVLTEAEIPAALPAEPEAPSDGRNVLVYREAAEGFAARAYENGEASPQPGDGGDRKASSALPDAEEIGGRSAQAIPAQPVSGETERPVTLAHRTGAELQPAAAVGRVSRDIRVTAEHEPNPTVSSKRGKRQARKAASPAEERMAHTALPLRTGAEAEAIPAPALLPESERMPKPPALVYAAPAQAAEGLPEEAAVRPVQKAQENKKESLPNWAKELLEQAGVTDTAQQAAAFNGRLDGLSAGRTVNWSAPGTGTPSRIKNMNEPAELSFKEKESAGETPPQTRISDEEIRRAADRVYRIIEERLRLELRRGGR